MAHEMYYIVQLLCQELPRNMIYYYISNTRHENNYKTAVKRSNPVQPYMSLSVCYKCLYKIAIYMCIQIPRLAVAIMFSCEYEHRNT